MRTELTIAQRINLHFLVGTLPAKDIKWIRLAWQIMDKLELSEEEKKAINYELVPLDPEGNQLVPRWTDGVLPAKEFDFDRNETAFLRHALESAAMRSGLLPGPARVWLEPLINTFILEED